MPRSSNPNRGVVNPGNNRTDLPGKVPVETAPGQGVYGNATSQRQSQRILPVSQQPVAGPASVPTAPSGGSPTANATPPTPGAASAPTPGSLPWIGTPTQRPTEPLMTPATGALGQLAAAQTNEQGSLKQLLGHLASTPGASSVIRGLAATAGATVA